MELRGVYNGEIPSTLDILIPQQNGLVALSELAMDVLQSNINPANITNVNLVAGFTPSYNANLTVNLDMGRLYTIAQVNPTVFGDLAIDTRNTLQQAQADAQVLTFAAAPVTAGQSRIDLVQVTMVVTDDQMAVLPYFNSANPATPLNGAGGGGVAQANRRWRKAVVSIKQGTAGVSPTAPTPDAGNSTLFRMTIAQGTTAITGANITVDPAAPFIAGITTKHHTGAPGSAPKIDLLAEVQNALPIANGGTGQTAKTAGYNALAPLTTLGDVAYHDGTNVVRLAPNTSVNPARLRMTGNGSVGAAPVWDTSLPVAITTSGGTPANYVGLNGNNNTYFDASTGTVIQASGSLTLIMDSDNNSTTDTFRFATNAPNTTATTVATIDEKGNFSGQAAFVDDFGQNFATTTALTYGYFGGNISKGATNIRTVANGTVALSASTTNYVEVDPVTGIVSTNVVGFTAGRVAMQTILTGASTITTVTDSRDLMGTSDVPIGTIINPLAYNPNTTAGLNFGYFGGSYTNASNVPGTIAASTIALTASTTNYVELDVSTGTVVKNVTGFTLGRVPLYTVVTGAASVTTVTDKRSLLGGGYAAVAGTLDNYMQNPQTTTGLTFGYFGGNSRSGNNIMAVANGTVALTNTATNYIELDLMTGTVAANTVGFTDGKVALYTAVTAGGVITSVVDKRSYIGGSSTPTQLIVNPYAQNPATTTGLTFGYLAGQVSNDNVVAQAAAGTILLTASTTNYVEANPTTAVVTTNTAGFTSGRIPLYSIVTGGAAITTINDRRSLLVPSGTNTQTIKSSTIRQNVIQAAVDPVFGNPAYAIGGLSTVNNATQARAISGGDLGVYAKSNAFDGGTTGVLATAWNSSQLGAAVNGAAYIGQDSGVGNTIPVAGFTLYNYSAAGVNNVTSVLFQTAPDGVTWTTQQTIALDASAGGINKIMLTTPVNARAWRLVANSALTAGAAWAVTELQTFPLAGTSATAVDFKATTVNVLASYAAGNTSTGETNFLQAYTADINAGWTGLTAGVPNYLYMDRNSGAANPTLGSVTLAPVVQNFAPTPTVYTTQYSAPGGGVAANAFDATPATTCVSNTTAGSTFTFLQVDFGGPAAVTQIVTNNFFFTGASGPNTFQWQSSPDGVNWTNFGTAITAPTVTGTNFTSTTSVTTRYFRMQCMALASNGTASTSDVTFTVTPPAAVPIPTGQHWYNPTTGLMQSWNGAAWVAVQRIFAATALMSGSNIKQVLPNPIGQVQTAGGVTAAGISSLKVVQALNAQAIPAGTPTKIIFDKVLFDNGFEWDVANNRAVCTIPGKYTVKGSVGTTTNGTGYSMLATIYVNGVADTILGQSHSSLNGSGMTANGDTDLMLKAGDYVELWANSGNAVNTFVASAGGYFTWFTFSKALG